MPSYLLSNKFMLRNTIEKDDNYRTYSKVHIISAPELYMLIILMDFNQMNYVSGLD